MHHHVSLCQNPERSEEPAHNLESRLSGKRIVITGGCGFIGSHLVESLWQANEVIVVDDLSSGSVANLAGCDVRVVHYDVTDHLDDILTGVDIVFHTAAHVQVASSIQDPMRDAQVNILGSLRVAQSARRAQVKRIVYSSSAAVYGVPENIPIAETHPTNPISPYGLSKLTGERYFLMYHRLEGLPVVCLRYFNVFGPRQDDRSPYSGVIAIFARNLLAGRTAVIYGDGGQTRDFIHVADVVWANVLAAALPAETVTGQVFNVGTGMATSLNQLAETMGLPADVVRYESERSGDIRHSVADTRQAAQVMGFQARVSLSAGLKSFLTWLRAARGAD